MIPELPWHSLKSEWRDANPGHPDYDRLVAEYNRATKAPGWNPKTVKLSNGETAIDFCGYPDGRLHSYHVTQVEDHPFLNELPKNAPKVIRHIYRADVRLRYLRADEGWDEMRDRDRAEQAREDYNRNLETRNGDSET